MVRLLHHYETSTHRIFLLLEYVGGGRLLDFVANKREQWKKLQEAVTNPPPSSSLVLSDTSKDAVKKDKSLLMGKHDDITETSDTEGKGIGHICYMYMYT